MRPHYLLLLMAAMTVPVTLANMTEGNEYNVLEAGKNITGTIRAELKARSKQECSVR